MKEYWHVIYTKPRHEKKVAGLLEHLNVTHFLPTVRSVKIYQGKRRLESTPLFPSYIFVKVNSTAQYFESLHLPGVIQYVRTGKEISRIGESIINTLKGIVEHQLPDMVVTSEYIHPGSFVTIYAGPFAGFTCEVIQHNGKRKILVRIELLKRSIVVGMPEDYLIPHFSNAG